MAPMHVQRLPTTRPDFLRCLITRAVPYHPAVADRPIAQNPIRLKQMIHLARIKKRKFL